nr:hypothetical protein [Haliscomenobacter sp.]
MSSFLTFRKSHEDFISRSYPRSWWNASIFSGINYQKSYSLPLIRLGECGIATYSQDLLKALKNQYHNSFSLKVCALETGTSDYVYPKEVKYQLNTQDESQYQEMAHPINIDMKIELVLFNMNLGSFKAVQRGHSSVFILADQTSVIVFHTVLPRPDAA